MFIDQLQIYVAETGQQNSLSCRKRCTIYALAVVVWLTLILQTYSLGMVIQRTE